MYDRKIDSSIVVFYRRTESALAKFKLSIKFLQISITEIYLVC